MNHVTGSEDRAILLQHLPQPAGVPPLVVTSDIELRFAYPVAAGSFQEDRSSGSSDAESADSFVEVVGEASALTEGGATELYALWDTGICPGHIWRRYQRQADLQAHPLAERGLSPCGVFEVRPSAWLQHLQRTEPENLPAEIIGMYVSPLTPIVKQVRYHHMLFAFNGITLEFITDRLTYELFQTAEQVRQELRRIKWGADAY